jgi:hypothetical protein
MDGVGRNRYHICGYTFCIQVLTPFLRGGIRVEHIRLATPEEIDKIKDDACLTPMSRVLAMGDILAVHRVAHELDPVFFNGAPVTRMYKFLWGVENIFKGMGLTEYFYNTPADDPKYHKILEELGAQRTSKAAECRWRVNL